MTDNQEHILPGIYEGIKSSTQRMDCTCVGVGGNERRRTCRSRGICVNRSSLWETRHCVRVDMATAAAVAPY